MPRGRAAALFSFVAIGLVVACGVEVVGDEDGPTNGSSSTSSSGGSTSSGSTSTSASSGTMPIDGGNDVTDAPDENVVDGADTGDDAAKVDAMCKLPGKPCTSSSECCDGHACAAENPEDPVKLCAQ